MKARVRRRRKRASSGRLRYLALGLALFELLYIICGNIFLRGESFSKVVNYDPQYIYAEYRSAWTILPGMVHLRGFLLRGQDVDTRWQFTLEEARARINLFALPFRKLHLTDLTGSRPAFRLYFKDVHGTRADERQPFIEGFIDNPPDTGSSPPERRFKFQFGDIDLEELQELWIDRYRFTGGMDVEANNVFLWPANYVEVEDSAIEISDGSVKSGGDVAVHKLTGDAEVTVGRYPLSPDSKVPFVSLLSGRVKLAGVADDPFFFNGYVDPKFPLRFSSLRAAFDLDVSATNGQFTPESLMKLEVNRIEAQSHDSLIAGQGRFEAAVSYNEQKLPFISLKLELPEASARYRDKEYFATRGLVAQILGPDTQIENLFSGAHYRLSLDRAHFLDLQPLNDFFASTPLKIRAGQAMLTTRLSFDAKRGNVSDDSLLEFETRELKAQWGRERWMGDLRIKAQALRRSNDPQTFSVAGSELSLTNAMIDSNRDTNQARPLSEEYWNTKVSLLDGSTLSHPDGFRLDAMIAAESSNTGPMLDLFASQVRVSPTLRTLLSMKRMKMSSRAMVTPTQFAFDDIRVQSESLKFGGHVRQLPDKEWDVGMLVDSGLLKIGVTMKNGKRNIGVRSGSVSKPVR